MKKTIYTFIIWRLFLFIPLAVSQVFLTQRPGFSFAFPMDFINSSKLISSFLIYPWGNFDAIYYLTIAESGYTANTSGFFPLFPMLIRYTNSILGAARAFDPSHYFIALFLTSLLFLLGLIMTHILIKLDYKENIAMLTIFFILVFPTSFFFASIYSESLFFLLLVSSFYFARRKKWLIAGLLGMLLSATRIVGVAIFPALLLEFYLQNKTLFSKKIIPIFLTPIGLISYSLFNLQSFGNAFQFVKVQGMIQNNRTVDHIILFPQTVFRYFKILTNVSPSIYEWWVALLEVSLFFFAAVLLYIAWKKKVRASYVLFSVLAFLVPTSTGTFSGLPRYVLVLFPIFIALSLIKNKYFKIAYVIFGIILLFLSLALFSKGYFIA